MNTPKYIKFKGAVYVKADPTKTFVALVRHEDGRVELLATNRAASDDEFNRTLNSMNRDEDIEANIKEATADLTSMLKPGQYVTRLLETQDYVAARTRFNEITR